MSPMSPWGDIFIDQQHTVPILLDGGAVAGLALRPVAPALSAREANVCVRCAIGDRKGAWFPADPRPNVRVRVLCQAPPRTAPPRARARPTPFVRSAVPSPDGSGEEHRAPDRY